jgi:membrane protein implicated in regulation of membrane protease activity
MLAAAATVAAVVAGVDAPPAVQVAAFAVTSVLLIGVVRPVARRHRHVPVSIRTGTDALVGRRATTLTAVDRHGGQVRRGGEVWTARSYDDDVVIPAGAADDVAQIDGATAVVLPLERE